MPARLGGAAAQRPPDDQHDRRNQLLRSACPGTDDERRHQPGQHSGVPPIPDRGHAALHPHDHRTRRPSRPTSAGTTPSSSCTASTTTAAASTAGCSNAANSTRACRRRRPLLPSAARCQPEEDHRAEPALARAPSSSTPPPSSTRPCRRANCSLCEVACDSDRRWDPAAGELERRPAWARATDERPVLGRRS